MEKLSIFDIIGPNMIGPSSSHTAGALKIARLAKEQVRGRIIDATFRLYGSFAATYNGHGTDRALISGLLGFETTDYRIRDAFDEADSAGLVYKFLPDFATKPPHPNTVDIHMTTDAGENRIIRGISKGGGAAAIEILE